MLIPTRRDRAHAIRFLSIDAVQRANSGHPGMPMGMADIAEVLWYDFLKHNPSHPHWWNRDRFVLSNGHGCMLQYALIHLTGYDLTIEDLKQFRQLHSKTPGHPEWGITPGVETTTGPLGQGLANAIGMAIAEKHLAAIFNRPHFPIIDHFIYCFVGDGCLMEGISHEVASLAGTLGLGKLIVFYDDNGISIDGEVSGWFTDNTPLRFKSYGWHVIADVDGHKAEAVSDAISKAQGASDQPSLICCKTTIGWGSPSKAGLASTHGAALGEAEVDSVRSHLEWPHEPFVLPDAIYQAWDQREKGAQLEQAWIDQFRQYRALYPALADELTRRMNGEMPDGWECHMSQLIQELQAKATPMATRKASRLCLNQITEVLPEVIGGSADLAESNSVDWQGMTVFSRNNATGRFIHYGVREFGMAAINNGIALYNGLIPFSATFLTFSDYARNAIRLAALMRIHVIFVFTHDSIGLGEDGPTHQPIEHLPSLRLIPNLTVWRPCDSVETAFAWRHLLGNKGPGCLILSRQSLPFQQRKADDLELIGRGGYILVDHTGGNLPDAILMATGSEIALVVAAAAKLAESHFAVRVVSIPSSDVYLQQDEKYRMHVLPKEVTARVAVEAAASIFWHQFVGDKGKVIGLDHFGASAPEKAVFADCGFTVERVVALTKDVIFANRGDSPPLLSKVLR